MKHWIFFVLPLVTLQVSEPYNSTDMTLELKILSFVWDDMVFDLQTGRRMAKTYLAFLVLCVMSLSVSPDWLILLPK